MKTPVGVSTDRQTRTLADLGGKPVRPAPAREQQRADRLLNPAAGEFHLPRRTSGPWIPPACRRFPQDMDREQFKGVRAGNRSLRCAGVSRLGSSQGSSRSTRKDEAFIVGFTG